MRSREFDLAWIEEPTSPDDVLGHAAIARGIAPIRVATGEHVQNRVVFKQLLQAGGMDVMQIDATRVGGVNENIANLLLAAKFGVPVCPHAGGVGLCEAVQHLSMFDFVAVSGTMDGRMIEYVDHLHEHFVTPVVIERGRYSRPQPPAPAPRCSRPPSRSTPGRARTPARSGHEHGGRSRTARAARLRRRLDRQPLPRGQRRRGQPHSRRRGTAASATSTPRRITGSASRSAGSAHS